MSRSILVPLDYTGCAHEVADQAADYAARLGLDVVLFHAVSLPTGVTWATPVGEGVVPPTARDVLQNDAQTALKGFIAQFEVRGVKVHIETPEGDPVDAIVDRAEEDDIELVCMGTHGRTGIERFVLGSVAERVLRRAPCPVMVVRSQDPLAHPGLTEAQEAVISEADG